MFDVDELLSKNNQHRALSSLLSKRDGSGPDGLRISDFEDYWQANHERIERQIRQGTYRPSIARIVEITGNNGKRREIASINVTDRYKRHARGRPPIKRVRLRASK